MRILYLTWDDVTKPTCGCAQRSAFLYGSLKQLGEVDVVQLKHGWIRETVLAKLFRKLTKVARWPFGRPSVDLSALQLQLPTATKPVNSALQLQLLTTTTTYDLVVCRYLSTAAITQAWKIAPCYVDIDDMPTDAFSSVDGKRLPKILRPIGAVLVRMWQKYCLRKCAGAWAVSEGQAEYVRKLGIGKVGALPNLARRPGSDYNVAAPQEHLLMTVGLMGYGPNQEGVGWFLDNVWTKVHERWPDLRYAIAGGGLPDSLKGKWSAVPGVQVLGFVDDLDALYAKSLAVVTPILSGAGTCIKVVEAGLHGRFVLATPKALRGHESLLLLGGIRSFEAAEGFCSALAYVMGKNMVECKERLAEETERVNSIEAFDAKVMEVIKA